MANAAGKERKKLSKMGPQLRFVASSMTAFFMILLITITAINLFAYVGTLQDADRLLDFLEANGGDFPEPEWTPGREDGIEKIRRDGKSPEVPYESRFFSVLMDTETGEVISTETSKIVTLDDEGAAQLAQKIFEKKNRGNIYQYRYLKTENDGVTRIIFLDIWRQFELIKRFCSQSIIISLICFLVVLALISYFSKRIIGPVIESYEKQKRFITDAGHEIKTPLAIINADADVLEMEFDEENEWVADIKKQTRHLTDLTNDLVYLARMEETDRVTAMIEFPLSDIVEDDVQSFRVVAKAENKSVSSDIQPDIVFNGDEKAVRELIEILLDNAIKYSPEGTQIDVDLKLIGKNVQLSVANVSAGELTNEDLERIFERFYRADKSRNSQAGGTGIGLSIAKAVVEAHKGSIRATREGEDRIRFTAVMPV